RSRPPYRSTEFFTAPTTTYNNCSFSLHDALPIFKKNVFYIKKFFSEYGIFQIGYGRFQPFKLGSCFSRPSGPEQCHRIDGSARGDRKSTRLNASHVSNSYAVFCSKQMVLSASSPI